MRKKNWRFTREVMGVMEWLEYMEVQVIDPSWWRDWEGVVIGDGGVYHRWEEVWGPELKRRESLVDGYLKYRRWWRAKAFSPVWVTVVLRDEGHQRIG